MVKKRMVWCEMGAIALLGAMVGALVPAAGQAAPVVYDFTVDVTQGTLAGQSFSGSFRYDDATLKGQGREVLGVADGLTVCMNYLGGSYRETADHSYPTFPTLVFQDGRIQQLDFWIQPNQRMNWWQLPGWAVNLTRREQADAPLECQSTLPDRPSPSP